MLKASYPYYLAGRPEAPNSDLEVLDKFSGEVATRVAMADEATIDRAIAKAVDIIHAARREIYLRLFPDSCKRLEKSIRKALKRGVSIRLIGMGTLPQICDIQVIHPGVAALHAKLGGESIDIIVDRGEALVGIFETGQEAASPVIWTRNRWFVIANRDSLRHDFYHYFLDKLYDRQAPLSSQDEAIYAFTKKDD